MAWNNLTVKRIEFDDHGRVTVIEFYEGAGLTDVVKAISQYKLNGGMARSVEEALILTEDFKAGFQYPPSPKHNAS